MEAVAELKQAFLGSILDHTAPAFDDARRVHNGLIDRHPALIARCRGIADIVDAVRFARAEGLEIAVRGGGHNVGGRAVADGALVIDLSLMKGIHVDPAARTAIVEGGATWKEFNREAQVHGLATTGGVVGTTGVAGLTLGGGLGWLMPKYGMALDNLEAATLVLADGRVVRASQDHEPDLFWAIRGGGGNFGVAASFEFRLHAVGPMVTGGIVAFPVAEAAAVLRQFRVMAEAASDDLMMMAALTFAPDGSGTPIVAVVACHLGPEGEAVAAADRIRGFGTVMVDAMGPIPYAALNGMLDANFPAGQFYYWKSAFLPALPDEAVEAIVSGFARCPVPSGALLLEGFHGAVTRVPVEATAYAMRQKGYNSLVLGHWTSPTDQQRTIAWTRETFDALQRFVGPTRYLNYLGDDDDAAAAAPAAYGPNLPRLRAIKRRYDPDNVFHHNVNIPPAG